MHSTNTFSLGAVILLAIPMTGYAIFRLMAGFWLTVSLFLLTLCNIFGASQWFLEVIAPLEQRFGLLPTLANWQAWLLSPNLLTVSWGLVSWLFILSFLLSF